MALYIFETKNEFIVRADGIKRNKKANGNLFLNKIWHNYPTYKIQLNLDI